MPKKSQFQNLTLQQMLHDACNFARQPTIIQPAITLPIKSEEFASLPPARSFFAQQGSIRPGTPIADAARSEGVVSSTIEVDEESGALDLSPEVLPGLSSSSRKKKLLRGATLLLSALLILAIYFTWHATTPTSASPTVTQQAYSGAPSSQPTTTNNSSMAAASDSLIQVYIVGAIKHPGVYTLPADARIYQLVQAAGGTLPGADLVALNLAAKLTDGQEIYVLSIGETMPTGYATSSSDSGGGSAPTVSSGQLVNINTASETEMRQVLHISAATAQKIIAYRTQYGPYTSITQLLQVISKSIYDRIKNMVTV